MPRKKKTKRRGPVVTRGRGVVLRAKRAARAAREKKRRARGGKPRVVKRVVHRDPRGRFTKRSARERQIVQVLGVPGSAPAKRRRRSEVAEAIAALDRPRERVYSATTTTDTMAERALSATFKGEPVAKAFSRGARRSGVFTCQAGELSFVYAFDNQDLQEALAGILTAYFERAHAARLRVSPKALARSKDTGAEGYHARYSMVRGARVVWRIVGKKGER